MTPIRIPFGEVVVKEGDLHVLVDLETIKQSVATAGFTLVPTREIAVLMDCSDREMGDGDTARDCCARWLGRSTW